MKRNLSVCMYSFSISSVEGFPMKQTWVFAWFSVALSAIVLVAMLFGGPESSLPTFFCFLPVVFFMVARAIKDLTDRVAYLESVLQDQSTFPKDKD